VTFHAGKTKAFTFVCLLHTADTGYLRT